MSTLTPGVKETLGAIFLANMAWNYFHIDSKKKKDFQAVKDVPQAMAETLSGSLGLDYEKVLKKIEARRLKDDNKDPGVTQTASLPRSSPKISPKIF